MVLHGQYFATHSLGILNNGFLVDWLYSERIQDTDVNIFFSKLVSSFQGFVQCGSRSNNKHWIFGSLANDLQRKKIVHKKKGPVPWMTVKFNAGLRQFEQDFLV